MNRNIVFCIFIVLGLMLSACSSTPKTPEQEYADFIGGIIRTASENGSACAKTEAWITRLIDKEGVNFIQTIKELLNKGYDLDDNRVVFELLQMSEETFKQGVQQLNQCEFSEAFKEKMRGMERRIEFAKKVQGERNPEGQNDQLESNRDAKSQH